MTWTGLLGVRKRNERRPLPVRYRSHTTNRIGPRTGQARPSPLAGPPPDVALVHQLDLLVGDLATVLRVGVRSPVQIEVLRVDRFFVDELVLLGGQSLDPGVPLRAGPELPQRLHVYGTGHPR